jgi:hypothetical protein
VTARKFIIPFAAIAALGFVCSPAAAQQVSARARVDSAVYLVGDRISVKVELHHSRGLTIQPMVGDSVEGFAVLGRSGLTATTDTTSAAEFVLARYDSGDAAIPPLPFLYFVPNDTASHVALTNQLVITIHTVPQDTSASFRDIKPPMDIPMSWEEIALYAGVALLVAGLGYLAYRLWRRRLRKFSGEAYVPPPRPAHQIALEALGDLKAKKLWQQGLVKEYYSELSEIFRRYFEHRYNVPSLEETTDETLAGLRAAKIGDGLLGPAEVILRRADLVKFAKYHPTVTDHEDSYRGVLSFVEKTKVVAMTPVQAEGGRATANVES